MKRMKKIFAMLLAFTMILGMTVTANAANAIPNSTNTAKITVSGIEAGATVKAYKIVKADYNAQGLVGYSKVDQADVFDMEEPSSDEITVLAEKYRGISSGVALDTNGDKYELITSAGTYLILVEGTPSAKVYNPMIVSLAYKTYEEDNTSSGSSNELQLGEVDATKKWELGDADLYAKSSTVDITKKITSADKKSDIVGDIAYGDTVSFEINTTVPDYSKEYKSAVFKITDTMDAGLDLIAGSVVVTVTGAKDEPVNGTHYEIIPSDHGFIVDFISSEWLLANGAAAVKVEYSATVNTNATTNFVPNLNKVKLTYTNNPGEEKTTEEKITRHYTFEIDGAVNGTGSTVTEEIRKMGTQIINGKEETGPLADAKFAIRKKGTTDVIAETKSTAEGLLNFKGLDADTDYEIYEVEAPKGWTINDTIYTARITAEYDEEGILKDYKVVVTHVDDEGKTVSAESVHSTTDKGTNVTVNNNTTDIPNTKLVKLPSTGGIGTTIFTVAGCGIMIAAAFFFFASRKKEN